MPSGIYKRKPIIKKGQKFNRLTAVKFVKKDKKSNQFWLFRCDCGNEKIICVSDVRRGMSKSCGCLRKERMITHGMRRTGVYESWAGMKDRCLNKNNKRYKDYGDRKIIICKRWLNFENFYKDMGERPKEKSLDRIDNNGNYCKENCRWATREEQANNTRKNVFITYNGKTRTIAQWARELGAHKDILYWRLNKGWSVEKILNL